MNAPTAVGAPLQGPSPPVFPNFSTTLSLFAPRIRAACRRHRVLRFHEDDLFQAGAIALWRSTQSYDPSKGTPFEHYAARAIRRAVAEEARRELRHWEGRAELNQGDADDDRELDLEDLPRLRRPLGEPPEDDCFDRVLLQQMREWAARLPDELLRHLYDLRHVRGLTQAEAASEMRVSQQRVSYLEQRLARLTRAAA